MDATKISPLSLDASSPITRCVVGTPLIAVQELLEHAIVATIRHHLNRLELAELRHAAPTLLSCRRMASKVSRRLVVATPPP